MMPPLLPDSHPMLGQKMPYFNFRKDDGREIAATLANALDCYGGIGIAANQIGIPTRAFAFERRNGEIIVCFNPEIEWVSDEQIEMEEGCLTFPNLFLKIKRAAKCRINFIDVDGKPQVIELDHIDARCALHEIDHLDGIVFTKRVSRLRLNMAKKKTKNRLT